MKRPEYGVGDGATEDYIDGLEAYADHLERAVEAHAERLKYMESRELAMRHRLKTLAHGPWSGPVSVLATEQEPQS